MNEFLLFRGILQGASGQVLGSWQVFAMAAAFVNVAHLLECLEDGAALIGITSMAIVAVHLGDSLALALSIGVVLWL